MIGFIGGSGMYELFSQAAQHTVTTPYGAPAGPVTVGKIGNTSAAFIPRHGPTHAFPPHRVPYRANLAALQSIGVDRIVASCAVGSLNPSMRPGDFVILDQYIDRTWGREFTIFEGPAITHASVADPYCPLLRAHAQTAAHALGYTAHPRGTVVVIQGPRFSTRAESKLYRTFGADVINMTQSTEAGIAREMELCYGAVALVTDFDAGLEGEDGIAPVTHEQVLAVFKENIEKVTRLFHHIASLPPPSEPCTCAAHNG